MTDPLTVLGAAAAASQLAEQIVTLVVSIAEFYAKVRDAPETTRQQLLHVDQLGGICRLIIQNEALQKASIESVLRTCMMQTKEIAAQLRRVFIEKDDGRGDRLAKALLAAMKEKKFGKMFEELEKQKATLLLCISEVNSSILHTIGISVTRIETSVSEIKVEVVDTQHKVTTIANAVPDLSQGLLDVKSIVSTMYDELPEIQKTLNTIVDKLEILNVQPLPPPPPTLASESEYFKVPPRRTATFVGREAELDILHGVLSARTTSGGTSVAVLRGMGGQGKTQIALQFCYRTKSNPFTAVFWIDATSEASTRSAFETIFDIVKPHETVRDTSEAKIDFVLDYLSQGSRRWLLIFDNYDKLDYRIQDFFPDSSAGSILVTSRHAGTRDLIMTNEDGYVELQGLEEKAALDLLHRVSKVVGIQASNSDAAKIIVQRLGYHALAITQAASYISKRRGLRLESFMEHYETRREIILQTTPELTEYRRKLQFKDNEIALNVFTTWELSFQQLEEETNDDGQSIGAKILTLLAFFDTQDVSEVVLERCVCDETKVEWENAADLTSWLNHFGLNDQWDSYLYEDIIINLADLSLVQTWVRDDIDKRVHVTIHPLVRDWIRLRISSTGYQMNANLAWILCGVAIYQEYYDGRPWHERSAATRRELLRHVQMLMTDEHHLRLEVEPSGQGLICELHRAQWYCARMMYDFSLYASAEKVLRRNLVFYASFYGFGPGWANNRFGTLSSVLNNLKRHEIAAQIQQLFLKIGSRYMGWDDEAMIAAAGALAKTLSKLGRTEEVEALLRDLVSRSEIAHGSNSLCTLSERNRLGRVLARAGKWSEAEGEFRKAYEGCKEITGPEQRNTLINLKHLAKAISNQGPDRTEESLHLLDRAIKGWTNAWDANHPQAIACRDYRAKVLKRYRASIESISASETEALNSGLLCLTDNDAACSISRPIEDVNTTNLSDPQILETLGVDSINYTSSLNDVSFPVNEKSFKKRPYYEFSDVDYANFIHQLKTIFRKWGDLSEDEVDDEKEELPG